MHKKVLTEVDLYRGEISMPKGFEIDRDKIRNDIIESYVKQKRINTNPQATSNHLGCPASSEKRDVVDNSFTYCYTMSFPNLESHDIYQRDPTHKLFIDEVGHLWKRVVVSDSNALL